MDLKTELRKYIKQTGITQEALAHEIGVTLATMSRWISRDKVMSPMAMKIVKEYLEEKKKKAV